MLGKSERESAQHARLAAQTAGWDDGDSVLLDLGSRTATLATIAAIDAISAVVHIGHPAQPDPELERLLLASDNALIVTHAASIESQWTLVARSTETNGTAVIDEAGMRDCRHVLRSLGITPHVIASSTSVEDRVELAGEHGMIVLERSLVPQGFQELEAASQLSKLPALWYGLLQTADVLPEFEEASQVWLAVGPHQDHKGSLLATLNVFATHGIDLQHLRSQRSTSGPAVFLTSFGISGSTGLKALLGELSSNNVQYRVLAVLPGSLFVRSRGK